MFLQKGLKSKLNQNDMAEILRGLAPSDAITDVFGANSNSNINGF